MCVLKTMGKFLLHTSDLLNTQLECDFAAVHVSMFLVLVKTVPQMRSLFRRTVEM